MVDAQEQFNIYAAHICPTMISFLCKALILATESVGGCRHDTLAFEQIIPTLSKLRRSGGDQEAQLRGWPFLRAGACAAQFFLRTTEPLGVLSDAFARGCSRGELSFLACALYSRHSSLHTLCSKACLKDVQGWRAPTGKRTSQSVTKLWSTFSQQKS